MRGQLPAPSPRPPDISEEDWNRLFSGEPKVIIAYVVTRDGVSWYDIANCDPTKPEGLGIDQAVLRVANGIVTIPAGCSWACACPTRSKWSRHDIEKAIEIRGIDEVRRGTHEIYYESPPPVKISPFHDYDKYFPEEIGASKQLGLLPKDYVPL